jgi:indolepyruvate ferredoxin oxidoreductase alpha subunit
LCAGCPERAAFFAIKKALPKAIYASDIGCYTLGLNLKAVDTVLDMGAGITLASGFYQAYHQNYLSQRFLSSLSSGQKRYCYRCHHG